MSKGQTLRALVNERLTAAAEEIFGLFERTIAEYEEELCRSKHENQRKQRLLDSVLNPRVLLPRAGAGLQIPSQNPPDPGLNLESTQTAWIKDEPEERLIEQEEVLSVFVPEFSSTCVKTEEFSPLQLRHTEHQEETLEENISSAPHFHSVTEGDTEHSSDTDSDDDSSSTDSDDDSSSTDSDEDLETPLTCTDAQMETDGDFYNQVQIRDPAAQNSGLFIKYQSAPETSAILNNLYMSRTDEGPEIKKYKCCVCLKIFRSKLGLRLHSRVHTRECCSACEKKNGRKISREECMKTHTSETLLSCTICQRIFPQLSQLKVHMKTHTVFSCPFCQRTFSQKCNLTAHLRLHTGERPYSCAVCSKTFTSNWNLKSHMRTHTKAMQSGAEGNL